MLDSWAFVDTLGGATRRANGMPPLTTQPMEPVAMANIEPNSQEEWRPVAGWPYEVSNFGRIRRSVRARFRPEPGILNPHLSRTGYYTVLLRDAPRHQGFLLSRLVCSAFHGESPFPGAHCAHNDGNPKNNAASNLRWATARENSRDTDLHGTRARGFKLAHTKLSGEEIKEILALLKSGTAQKEISQKYGIGQSYVSRIKHRNRRKVIVT